MHLLRTRFKKDIVAEFLPPARATKKQKVIIFCDGLPAVPYKKDLMLFFSKKGYWVFHPRYRGTWESGGTLLKRSPHLDILDVIDQLPRGFTDIWDKTKYKVRPDSLYVIGVSFGGPAAILASRDSRVTKSVAIASVVDSQAPSRKERLDKLYPFITEAFGNGYRISKANWQKLIQGKIYNPVNHIDEIDGSKLLMIHALDDKSVLAGPVKKFAKKTKPSLILLKTGGHLSTMVLTTPKIYKKLMTFFKHASRN